MDKKIEDYLHLYYHSKGELTTQDDVVCEGRVGTLMNQFLPSHIKTIKPILRPLSDMADWELADFAKIHNQKIQWTIDEDLKKVIGRENIGVIQHFYFDDGLFFVEEVHNNIFGQQTGGDTCLANISPSDATRLLLSKGFDLFGLIESGLAISKVEVSNPLKTE